MFAPVHDGTGTNNEVVSCSLRIPASQCNRCHSHIPLAAQMIACDRQLEERQNIPPVLPAQFTSHKSSLLATRNRIFLSPSTGSPRLKRGSVTRDITWPLLLSPFEHRRLPYACKSRPKCRPISRQAGPTPHSMYVCVYVYVRSNFWIDPVILLSPPARTPSAVLTITFPWIVWRSL